MRIKLLTGVILLIAMALAMLANQVMACKTGDRVFASCNVKATAEKTKVLFRPC